MRAESLHILPGVILAAALAAIGRNVRQAGVLSDKKTGKLHWHMD